MRLIISIILVFALPIIAAIYLSLSETTETIQLATDNRSFEQQVGTRYHPVQPQNNPALTEVTAHWFEGASSIWGATGRDDDGHIWLGVSGNKVNPAHLVEFDPDLNRFIDHGDPVSALRKAGIYREGEEQNKIHSKIIQMDDGWLYFSSMDETGEQEDGSRLPKWGSHFWRFKPSIDEWEHLFSAPEGLIAVSGVGRWVYALGYWGHVLYQYDTHTGLAEQIRVGSEGGHISRNFLTDKNGHVYVPKVKHFGLNSLADEQANATDRLLVVTLVEYDQQLNELKSTPLLHYAAKGRPRDFHGVTSFSYLVDGSLVFGTHLGYLYKITPSDQGPAAVTELGWLHPDGESYSGSLFPLDGRRYLAGITHRSGKGYQLFRYDIEQRKSQSVDFDSSLLRKTRIFGSNTRDEKGRGYVVGYHREGGPAVIQLEF